MEEANKQTTRTIRVPILTGCQDDIDPPATGDTAITLAAIAGVTVPVTGETPTTAITATGQYTGTVTWSPADDPYAASKVYTAIITLTPKTGYTLTGVTANSFTVAGATTVTNPVNSGVITAVFPATAATAPTSINIAAIPDVIAPVVGAIPDTTEIDTEQYTGSVAWTPEDDPYKGETVYTATITLTPKAGFTLTGVTANFFTVAGETATNAANSGLVTAVFLATGKAPITFKAIPGVIVPVRGETPVTVIVPTDQYTGTVAWSPAGGSFVASKVYTATIILTPKAGFTLDGVAENFFTVLGATTDENLTNSGVITAVFPETLAEGLAKVLLGSAGDYAILAETTVTTTALTDITGDLGLSPAAASFFTGFGLIKDTGFATSALVTGKLYAADMADPTPINLTTAVANMITAYNDAAGRSNPDKLNLGSGAIGGETLVPGLYRWTSTVNIDENDLTLNGGANDVWIFQITNNLNLANGFKVVLTGGAKPENIFWQVAEIATLGTTSHMEGIILSKTQIILMTSSSINGRLLAQTQVTLDAATVVDPAIL